MGIVYQGKYIYFFLTRGKKYNMIDIFIYYAKQKEKKQCAEFSISFKPQTVNWLSYWQEWYVLKYFA